MAKKNTLIALSVIGGYSLVTSVEYNIRKYDIHPNCICGDLLKKHRVDDKHVMVKD